MRRAIRVRIITACLVAAATTALLELASRLVLPCHRNDDCYWPTNMSALLNSGLTQPPSDGYDERFGYRLTPGAEAVFETAEYRYTVRASSLGFRTKEITPREPGERRVLLLGGSFFFGLGVDADDMIESQLERLSEAEGRFAVSAYTFALADYNTVQELIVAREFIETVQPDETVVGFYVGNDVLTNAMSAIDEQGNLVKSDEMLSRFEAELDRAHPFLLKNSVLFRFFVRGLYLPRLRHRLAAETDNLERTFRVLEQLATLVNAQGSAFWVVIIYPRDGVGGGAREWWLNSRGVARAILEFCETQNIPTIDLLDEMEGKEDSTSYYFADDGHFNAAGNRRVAEVIYRRILSGRASDR